MRRLVTCSIVFSLVLSQGCALLVRGTKDTVGFSGDRLEVDGKPAASGPVELRRRQIHVVSAMVNGQRETRTVESDLSPGWFVFDLLVFGLFLAPVGSIAFLVDLATGSLYDLDPVDVAFQTSGTATPVCAACGAPLTDRVKFCPECGSRRGP